MGKLFPVLSRMNHRVLGRLLVLSLCLTSASCGSSSIGVAGTTTTSSTSITILPQMTQLAFPVPYLPQNFNPNTPAGDQSVTRQIMANVWPSVFYENSKYQPVLNSTLMDSAELVSTNPEEIVYKINPKAVWSDGVPISAADFIFNWKAQAGSGKLLDASNAPFLANSTIGYSDIKSIKSSNGGKTATVVFQKYFSEWESLFQPLVPAHIAERVGWNAGFELATPTVEVAGGPYEIDKVIPGKEVTLNRNPRYWGKQAVISQIKFVDDPNPTKYAAQMADGSLNLIDSPSTDLLYSDLKVLPNVVVHLVPSSSIQELIFNLSSAPLSDPKVRQAIALGIDRQAITGSVLGSYDAGAKPAGNNIFQPGLQQYQDNGKSFLTADPSRAVATLLADGYKRSISGIMTKNGQPLVLKIAVDSGNEQLLYVEELITEELSAIGIVVNPVNFPASVLQSSVLSKGDFDMAIVSESASPNAAFHVSRYQSKSNGSGGNYSRYSSKQADSLIRSAASELDPASSDLVYNELDQLIWKNLPTIPLYSIPDVIAYNAGYNFIGNSTSSSTIFWNASAWSYTPAQ